MRTYFYGGCIVLWCVCWAIFRAYQGDAFAALGFAFTGSLCAILIVCHWFMRNTRPL